MYEVQLQITNSLGCADTTNRRVRVDYHPVTKITKINSDSCLNNASFFKVDDLRAAKIPNILWTFSDASTFTDSSITKKFTTNGAQRVETIIANIFGCADTAELNFNLYKNPAASYTVADTFDCLTGNKFDFQSTSTTTNGSLNAYNWNFGNSSAAGSGSTTSYQYSDSGTYSVRLIVTNTLGCADSVRRLMRVNPNPRAYFNADIYLQCLNTNSTNFTDSSESNIANATLQYAWDFGDTTTAAVANPSKVYAYYGVKSVTAIVTNGASCADTVTRNIEIKPEPIARLSIADAAQCENNNLFVFTDTTVMPPRGGTHWVRWLVDEKEIGDSTTIQNYTIDSAKTYTLKMISNSEFGCQDSIEKLFRVLPKPLASIRYTSPDSCQSTTARFTAINSAGNGIKNANWLFSDGTRATGENTNKKYSTAGSKWIELILENTNGCFDTTRFEFNIHKNPVANFIAGNYSQCLVGNTFTFFDSSKAVAGSLDSIRWNFADGTIQKAISGSKSKYTFQTARSYRVRLIAYNSFACQDSTERTVIVKATPEADFDINNNSQCLNTNAFELTNKSQPNNGNGSMSYTWSFGDSSTSSSRNLTKKFQYDGGKVIRLISSNSDGCIDTFQKSVTVRSMPKADFTINTVSQCVNQNTYSYSDVSTIKSGGGTLSRIWNLGDGSVSNQKNISNKTYSSAQNFNIQLISRNNFSCADTVIKIIQILPKPNVNFTVNQDTQCLVSNNYAFNNQSSIVTGGGTLSYQWSYGEGSTSTNTHPSHSFKNFGTYQIKLRAQSQFGCVDSLKRPVKVVANPLVDFSFVNSNKQCNSLDTFSLANKTDKRNAFAVSYLWHFGDGTSSTQTNFKKSYQRSGDFRITLYAENKNGCKDSVSYNSKVYPDPVADFAINQAGQCINNQKFDFTNNTTVAFGGGSLSYQWLYSDTLFATSTQSTKSFNRVKTYGIKLIASSSLGCKDSISRNIVVYPKPIAKFDINDTTQCLNGNVFKLTNNSQVSSGTNSYQWNFGDVTGNSVVSPDKTYSKFGTYFIKLLALSNNACRDSITKKVTVHSQPTVRFSRSDTALCRYQNSFTFKNNSSNADASKISYRWNYSDGATDTVTNAKVGFKESGLYLIKLVGRSDFGCADSQIQSVRVFPQPTPSFTIKTANQCLTNNSYEATNYSTIASEGGTLSYRWEFGNASNSTLANPTWKYASDDTFNVRMYVESSLGCKDSLFKSVIVYPQPLVSFSVNKTSQCLGTNSFNLNNVSKVTYGSLKYDWTFGDGGRSVGISPLVKYNTDGKYRIGLYAATNFGCKDSAFVNVTVHPDPQALFSVNDENQCLRSNEFTLKNNTTLSAGTFNSTWDFGDAKGSNSKDPKHGYTDDGIYIIRLKVTSAESCMDSTYKIIQVYPQPSASYTINDSVQCINDNDFIFENKSRVNFGGLRSFWDFGDVSYSSNGTGRHTYSKTGTFDVRLVSFTAFACSDTVNQKVRITEIPQIAFTLDTAMLCERGNVFDATNKSTYKGIELIDYQWKSSDGYNVNALNYTHSYAERGNYKLKLVGRSSQGCMDSSTQDLKVFPQGESKVVVFDTLQCLFGNDFTFGNESKVDGASFSLMSWNFGGVFIDTQFRVTPNQFQFGDTGTYRVTLITTTENLCMDTSAVSIRVVPMPVAKLKNGTLSYCHNEQGFEYLDISQKEPGYSNEWIFNKQVVSNTDTLKPTFILPGKYGIRMVVFTEFGCSDTTSTIAISNAVPKAKIGVNNNEQCLETNEFVFSNVSTQFTKPTAFWDLGDGTLGSGNNITQKYSDAGEFVVTLVVENDSQCSDTARINVFVNPTPEASLDIEPTCLNIPVILASNSGIQFGKIVSYLWNMGDGANYSDSLPAHEYRKSGKNNISLAMRSNKGCYAIFYDSIDVFPNPEAAFSLLTERPTILKNNVGFLDSSTNAATLEWDFGDGSDLVYDEFEWYHTYSDTGNYRVQLAVVSFDGCTDTSSRIIRIWPDFNILLPTAFSPNADGINDIYHIRGNHHAITTAIWQVYTEDGIKVFESNDIEGGWNGQLMNNGKPLPMGNYQLNLVVKDMYGNQSQLNEKIAIIR
jgi:gliding motility-associated-like protein